MIHTGWRCALERQARSGCTLLHEPISDLTVVEMGSGEHPLCGGEGVQVHKWIDVAADAAAAVTIVGGRHCIFFISRWRRLPGCRRHTRRHGIGSVPVGP